MPIVINGSGSITGISAGGLPDGCVLDADINGMAASKLTGALPAISGASLTGISAGITMSDTWYVNAGLDPQSGANVITQNWTRNTSTNNGRIGSAMTQSSGIYTFPSTGIYHILIEGSFWKNDSTSFNYLGFYIQTTENNSTYTTAAGNYQALPSLSGATYINTSTHFVFDVVDTSTHKVRFATESDGSGTSIVDFSGRRLQVIFIRLGDT